MPHDSEERPGTTELLDRPPEQLGEVEERIRDPYLLDALRQYEVVQADLDEQSDSQHIESDVYLLCELSRDATIRLTPFSPDMAAVMAYALRQFRRTIDSLDGKHDLTEATGLYAGNIRKRIVEFDEYLRKSA